MSDVFEVAPPKTVPAKPKPEKPKVEHQPPTHDTVKREDVVAAAPKTRKKRTPRAAPEIDEHMLFMRLHKELSELSKKPRQRVLNALVKVLG